AEDGIRDRTVTGVQTCALPISGAIVDGGELIETPLAARNSLQKLHIQLEAMSRLGLLVSLPPFAVRPMLLVRGQAVQLVAPQDEIGRASCRERGGGCGGCGCWK